MKVMFLIKMIDFWLFWEFWGYFHNVYAFLINLEYKYSWLHFSMDLFQWLPVLTSKAIWSETWSADTWYSIEYIAGLILVARWIYSKAVILLIPNSVYNSRAIYYHLLVVIKHVTSFSFYIHCIPLCMCVFHCPLVKTSDCPALSNVVSDVALAYGSGMVCWVFDQVAVLWIVAVSSWLFTREERKHLTFYHCMQILTAALPNSDQLIYVFEDIIKHIAE